MKICVFGAGFAGLATCWHCLEKGWGVTLVEPKEIGDSPSGISAGLLHPFTGKEAKYAYEGFSGMRATRELLSIASNALGEAVFTKSGMLRPAFSQKQREAFKKRAEECKEVTWWTRAQCQEAVPLLPKVPGLFVPSALSVQTKKYLQGLYLACKKRGLVRKKSADREKFDLFIYATGANTRLLFPSLPLTPIKGQLLKLAWPKNVPPPSFPLNGKSYLVMQKEKSTCLLGATFERHFREESANVEVAREKLIPQLSTMLPLLPPLKIVDCLAGLRVATPNRLPLCRQIGNKQFVCTAFGSKGLLYHALFTKKLVQTIQLLFPYI